jgi:hypothetical protein
LDLSAGLMARRGSSMNVITGKPERDINRLSGKIMAMWNSESRRKRGYSIPVAS